MQLLTLGPPFYRQQDHQLANKLAITVWSTPPLRCIHRVFSPCWWCWCWCHGRVWIGVQAKLATSFSTDMVLHKHNLPEPCCVLCGLCYYQHNASCSVHGRVSSKSDMFFIVFSAFLKRLQAYFVVQNKHPRYIDTCKDNNITLCSFHNTIFVVTLETAITSCYWPRLFRAALVPLNLLRWVALVGV